MTTVDTKEIRGLNLRLMITIILGTISMVTAVLVTKNSLETQIKNVANDQATFSKVNDLNFKIFDVRVSTFEARLNTLEKRVDDNYNNLKQNK